MRWKTQNAPKNASTRVIKRFALFPKRLDDGYTICFESYLIHQTFFESKGGNYDEGGFWRSNATFNKDADIAMIKAKVY